MAVSRPSIPFIPSLANPPLLASPKGVVDFIVEGKGVVNTQYPGTCFGELSLIYGGARTATCHARTNCKVWTLDEPSYRLVQVAIARANRRRRMSQGDDALTEKQAMAKAQVRGGGRAGGRGGAAAVVEPWRVPSHGGGTCAWPGLT